MTTGDESARRAQEDAEWQQIIDGFGEAPEFPEAPVAPEPIVLEPAPEMLLPAELDESPWLDEDHFVPEPPPRVQRPRGVRALAWFGLFGVPVLVLVSIIVHVHLMTPLPFFMLVWFVGGFGYLVATMSHGPSDPDSGWDDGAVL